MSEKKDAAWRSEFNKTGRTQVRDSMGVWPEPKARVARKWLSDQDRRDRLTAISASIAAIIAAIAAIIAAIPVIASAFK
jgi:hypothetical protein